MTIANSRSTAPATPATAKVPVPVPAPAPFSAPTPLSAATPALVSVSAWAAAPAAGSGGVDGAATPNRRSATLPTGGAGSGAESRVEAASEVVGAAVAEP
jgi:hypothetical protein